MPKRTVRWSSPSFTFSSLKFGENSSHNFAPLRSRFTLQTRLDYYDRQTLHSIVRRTCGLLKVMPIFTLVFGLAALSSMGMPPLNGFIGEIAILGGAFQVSHVWAFWGAVGIALGGAYLLWLFQRTMLGEVKEKNRTLRDLSVREIAVFLPLIVWAFWIGLSPPPYFRLLDRSLAQIVERVQPGYYAARHLPNPLK